MKKVSFVSTNEKKFKEIDDRLKSFDIELEFIELELREIQSNLLEDIASVKSDYAYGIIKKPLIVEDSGIFILGLNNFPGPYSSYVFKTIGNEGILTLLRNRSDRDALFKTIITFNNGKIRELFTGELKGIIASKEKGAGWGYDPIFVPINCSLTYGELEFQNKVNISQRTLAADKFANWFIKTESGQ